MWTTCVGMRLRRGLIAMRQHALLLPSVVTIIAWFYAFPIKGPFDSPNIAMEASYLLAIAIGYFFVSRFQVGVLKVGWVLLLNSLLIELLEEFTLEPRLWNAMLPGLLGIAGLILVGVGFRYLVTRRDEENAKHRWEEDRAEEEALRESQEQLRKVFEDGPVGMALVDRDFRYFKVNKAFCQMLGYSEDELTRLSLIDVTHPEDFDFDTEDARKLSRGEISSYQREKRYFTKEKQILWARVTASLIKDGAGEILYSLSMIEDITERVRAANELRREKEFSQRLINSSVDGILAFDRKCHYTLWNPAMERISGVRAGQVLGKCAFDVLPLLKETGEDESSPFLVEILHGSRLSDLLLRYF